MNDIKTKAITGMKWTAVFSVYIAISNTLGLLIKSRFLSPEQFGGLSLLMLFIGLFQVLSDMGISQAIIQKEKVSNDELSSIFNINILFGLSLMVAVISTSEFISSFFAYEDLSDLLILASILILIRAPSILLKAILEKELLFKKIILNDFFSDLTLQVSTFIFLLQGLGLKSVVYAYLISNTISTVLYIFEFLKNSHYKYKLKLKLSLLKPFVRFGSYVTGQSLLSYFSSRIDIIVIGLILSPEILGIYFFGKNLLEKIHQLITTAFKKVLFPTFSKLSSDNAKLSRVYYKLIMYISFIAFPVFIGSALTAHLYIPIVFGSHWESSIIVIQVFSVFLIIKLITDKLTISLLYAKNKPALVMYTNLATTIVYTISLFAFRELELMGVIIAYALFNLYRSVIFQHFSNKVLESNYKLFYKNLWLPFICTIIMGSSLYLFEILSSSLDINNETKLFFYVVIGIVTYYISVKKIAGNIFHELVYNLRFK